MTNKDVDLIVRLTKENIKLTAILKEITTMAEEHKIEMLPLIRALARQTLDEVKS